MTVIMANEWSIWTSPARLVPFQEEYLKQPKSEPL